MTPAIIIEVLGFLAMGLNIWANIQLARMKDSGWILRLVCNAIWLIVGVMMLSPSIIANSLVFTGINIYGIRKWRAARRVEIKTYLNGLVTRDVQ